MGVPAHQVLINYMVVMQVEKVTKQERFARYNETKEDIKYFKRCDNEVEVMGIVSNLKANERIANIFAVNEFGNTFAKTIAFNNGRFELVDKEEEN